MARLSRQIERGRTACEERAWEDAYASLSAADQAAALGAEDLERLATATYMLGREVEHVGILERAHLAHLEAGNTLRAARCAIWAGLALALGGESGRASGWFGRAQRLVDREGRDCAERGYLLMPVLFQQLAAGDPAGAHASATAAAEIAERFGDRDLLALAVHEQGRTLLEQGRIDTGLGRLDEAMVSVTADKLSPKVTGLIYCSVIKMCHEVFALDRAQEWTAALTAWCGQQPGLVAFTGRCLIHRAEILQIRGAWREALEETGAASQRFAHAQSRGPEAEAFYRQGEIHRLRGEYSKAEAAYNDASRAGYEPQPGLALLRAAQGRGEAAAKAIRRVVAATTAAHKRAQLLPACVEIMLQIDHSEEAQRACDELGEIAAGHASRLLDAMAAYARGAVRLALGDASAAVVSLRAACDAWQALDAPYEAGRTRVLLGRACEALGDSEAMTMEFQAARDIFARLGARPDLDHVDALARRQAPGEHPGLTQRERQVLHLVAAGDSNREIASALQVSEHTVARHLQNIFAKLGVSSRTEATVLALKRDLI